MGENERELTELRLRVDKLEARMSFLLRRLNIAAEEMPAWDASPTVLDLVRKGDRNAAMRAYMDETACSLKDAKRFIESLEA
jgi:hypothetical protein